MDGRPPDAGTFSIINMYSQQFIILFDGECGLCCSLIKFIQKRKYRVKFRYIALQSGEGEKILKEYGLSALGLTSVVYIRNNHCYLKSTAVLFILKDLGGLWQALYILRVIPKPVRDAVYNLVSKNRHRFIGKQKSCKLEKVKLNKKYTN
jgi:predicted DCC family thiol-disulfide oxidoreductase YuxK